MWFWISLFACQTGDPEKESQPVDPGNDSAEDSKGVDDSDSPAPCTATVAALSPADGDANVAPDVQLVATFSEAVTEVVLELSSESGAVSGQVSLASDGLSALFVPDQPLDRDWDYVLTATVCDSSLSSSFHTKPGLSVDVTGKTYRINLQDSDLTWVKPNIGSFLVSYLLTKDVLFQVESVGGGQIDLVGAPGIDPGTGLRQYVCTPAIDFVEASFAAEPAFAVGPLDSSFSVGGYDVPAYTIEVKGTFAGDGTGSTNTTVTMLLDGGVISQAFGLDVCSLVSCVACPGGAPVCVEAEVVDAWSPELAGVTIDPANDPSDYRECL
ncbi:MAG TPA: Ig-like domain-containing protein [Myxococcota bacterium]|nr:Ig-like domain-containing protein [Myxococcota bacterium]